MSPLDQALGYGRLGWQVFPCHYPAPAVDRSRLQCSCGNPKCESPGKHPYARLAPRGHNSASADPGQIRKWFDRTPYNIAIRTGAASNIVVVDVDPRHDGDLTLDQLERQHGPLPNTWRFISGSGGPHLIFRHPGSYVPNDNKGKLGPGIDIKGDGGYIVAPPSRHVCGREYAIDVDHHPDDTPLADLPNWLLRLIAQNAARSAAPVDEWRKLVAEGVSEGSRNNAITRLAGHLLRRYVDPIVTLDLALTWNAARCRPPLDEKEVTKIVDSVSAREIMRRERANG